LKTHAKMMLITRRESGKIVRYAHLSTGNYNPGTARLYTDISHLTADKHITADVDHVFVHLTGQNRLPRLNRLLLAPLQLHRKLIEKIQALAEAAKAGQTTRLVAKMNALTDEPLIHALIDAGRAGVKIDLIIRGACMLPAQVPGHTENIRVRSVVGRFLEHSRVFYFKANEVESLYLSSADWMNRNMMRRVELAWPITDPVLGQRVVDECLDLYLKDQTNAWELLPSGQYSRVTGYNRKTAMSAQATLMKKYAVKDSVKNR
jgi:polyphosphate kinase